MDSVIGTDMEIPLEIFMQEYFNCRRNKRNKATALMFEWEYPDLVTRLYEDVNSFRYEIGKSVCFLVHYPKLREVFAADFRDRIVHHVIINRIGDLIESKFIDDSYNCRKGKGVYYGIGRMHDKIREASEGYKKKVYIVKNDLKGFFMSIDKRLMWRKLEKLVKEEYNGKDKDVLLYLIEMVVLHCPEKNCEIHGNANGWKKLSADKSLFTCGEGKGMPIGNLTSQIFANFYMSEFDAVMSERYGYYGRYVDDFYVICDSPEEASEVVDFSERWLKENLMLTLSRNKVYIQPYYNGVKFTGSVIKRSRIYVGNKTVGKFKERIDDINRRRNLSASDACLYINSYLGFMRQGRTYNIRRNLIASIDERYLRDISVSLGATKALSSETIRHREEKRSNGKYKKKRINYYKHKYRKNHEAG